MTKLLISEPALQVLPGLAEQVGLNEAIVLQQIHYWSLEKVRKGEDPWVYNTQGEWLEQFPWMALRTLQLAQKKLRDAGLLFEQQPEGTNRRKHYLVNYDALPDAANIAASKPQDRRDASRSIGGLSNNDTKTSAKKTTRSSQPASSDPPPNPPVVRSKATQEVEEAWRVYVEVMSPRGRGRELQEDDRKILRSALKVGDLEEVVTAIRTCELSDFHMKRGAHANRPGGKYKSLGSIFKPKTTKGQTWRSRLEWWLEKAEEAEAAGGSVVVDVNEEARIMREEQGL